MKVEAIRSDLPLGSVDPEEVALLLKRYGLEQRGGRQDLYSRWVVPLPGMGESARVDSLILPLNQRMADYEELLSDLISRLDQLALRGNEAVRDILERLILPRKDEYKFRKETRAQGGTIPWTAGEDLFAAARGILVAGAKARVSPEAYFGNRNSGFAKRYMESVLMGQTQVGSYVVTAFAPASEVFSVSESTGKQVAAPTGSFTGRDVTNMVLGGLEASHEAVHHFHETGSMSGFKEGVKDGVSRELVTALKKLTTHAEAADVTVEVATESTLLGSTGPITKVFEFTAKDYSVLEKAAARLASSDEIRRVSVTGWLSLVARPKRGEAGLVRMKVLKGTSAKTLQIRLPEDQFETAASAIAADRAVTVSGRQEKEKNRHWLYDVNEVNFAAESEDPGAETRALFEREGGG